MNILDIIEKKKQRFSLSESEIAYFIEGYTNGDKIKDYQASALLMAILINGMNDQETYWMTKAILNSGKIIDISSIKGIKIDKHSTGGVGDKVSIILAPIVAALGIKVAKISGKGLGHTGGTIDKIESIGIKTQLDFNEYFEILKNHGMFIIGQNDEIVPADKKLYALRDVTGTIDSYPLIAASIAAKKLAITTDYIFLDVKIGDGGFCKTLPQAKLLAKLLIKIIKKFNRVAIVHITNMDQPLGRSIGNAIEIKTSVEFLNGHPETKQLKDLIYQFVADILITTKKAKNKLLAFKMIDHVIDSKQALHKFYEWVQAQHGYLDIVKKDSYFRPPFSLEIKAPKAGYVEYKSTKELGLLSLLLGAGRIRKEDPISYQAGIFLNKVVNEYAQKDDVIATLYSSTIIPKALAKQFLDNCVFNEKPIKILPAIIAVVK